MLPWGTCDSRAPKELFSFDVGDNTSTKANRSQAGGVLHAKEGLGWGGGAHRERCSVGEEKGNGYACLPGA